MSRDRDYWLDALSHIDEQYVSDTVDLHLKQEEKESKTFFQRHRAKLIGIGAAAAGVVAVSALLLGEPKLPDDITSPADGEIVAEMSLDRAQFTMDYDIYDEYFNAMWDNELCTVDYFESGRSCLGFLENEDGAFMLAQNTAMKYELWYIDNDDTDTMYYAIDSTLDSVEFLKVTAKTKTGSTPEEKELSKFNLNRLMTQYDGEFIGINVSSSQPAALMDIDKDGDNELLIRGVVYYNNPDHIFVFEGEPHKRTLDCHFTARHLGSFETWHNCGTEANGNPFVIQSFSSAMRKGTYVAEIDRVNGQYELVYTLSWGTITRDGETVSFRRRGYDVTDVAFGLREDDLTEEEFSELLDYYCDRMTAEIKVNNEVIKTPSKLDFTMDYSYFTDNYEGIWTDANGDLLEMSYYSDDMLNDDMRCKGFAKDDNGTYMYTYYYKGNTENIFEYLWYIPKNNPNTLYRFEFLLGTDSGIINSSAAYMRTANTVEQNGNMSMFGVRAMSSIFVSDGYYLKASIAADIDKDGTEELLLFSDSSSTMVMEKGASEEHPEFPYTPAGISGLGYMLRQKDISKLKIYNTSPDSVGDPFAIYSYDGEIMVFEIHHDTSEGAMVDYITSTMLGCQQNSALPEPIEGCSADATVYYCATSLLGLKDSEKDFTNNDFTTSVYISKEQFYELLRSYTSRIEGTDNAMPDVLWTQDYALLEEHFFGSWQSDDLSSYVLFDYHEGSSIFDLVYGYGFSVVELSDGYYYLTYGGGGSGSYFIPKNRPDTMYLYGGGIARQAVKSEYIEKFTRRHYDSDTRLTGKLSEIGLNRLYDLMGAEFSSFVRSTMIPDLPDYAFEGAGNGRIDLIEYDENNVVLTFDLESGNTADTHCTFSYKRIDGKWTCYSSFTDESGMPVRKHWWIQDNMVTYNYY